MKGKVCNILFFSYHSVIKIIYYIIKCMKITIIDDNIRLAKSIQKFFEKQNDIVSLYHSRNQFMDTNDFSADVYIIDIALEDGNGLDIARYIREVKKLSTPILMISGYQGLKTKLEWFEIWIDDYIVKPFSPLELDARVKSILSRLGRNISDDQQLTYKDISFDKQLRKLTKNDIEIDLSKKEKQIVELFMENPGIFISKEVLIITVWWKKYDIDRIQNTINVSLCKVRKKLWSEFNLSTINSEGYILDL